MLGNLALKDPVVADVLQFVHLMYFNLPADM